MDPEQHHDNPDDLRGRNADQHVVANVPFLQSYKDVLLERQPIGGPMEHDVIVVMISKPKLKLYAFIVAFLLIIFAVAFIKG